MRTLLVLLLFSMMLRGEDPAALQGKAWRAYWIAMPGAPPRDYGVYHFRRTFELAAKPGKFEVHVSADQRYRLLVNGVAVGEGPARGDLNHWRFETYDLAAHLQPGRNVIAAQVWNMGVEAPIAQVTYRTGFVLQAGTEAGKLVDTTREWKAFRNLGYSPVPVRMGRDIYGYWAAGAGDRVDGSAVPWGWEQADFDDSQWVAAEQVTRAAGRDARDAHARWMMVPRAIPAMERRPLRLERLRWARGANAPEGWPRREGAVTIPANTKAELLLDQGELVTGYPELAVTGGKGALVGLWYAEALYAKGKTDKGNRDEVEGKEFKGNRDEFLPDGGQGRRFRPLWWRTWRYLRVTVETGAEPLRIDDLRGETSMYPFERKARFTSSNPELERMLDIGWRTARLCANETYMDCPYYEQLQYVGDTRIQALVSIYMSGDARLMRNAIEQIDATRTPEGMTYSRGPSELQQYIPGFSLWWIGMVHDYWRYVDDPMLVRRMMPGVRQVLHWYRQRQAKDGSVERLPWWPYVDWAKDWPGGEPPLGQDGYAAAHDLQLLLAYEYAADLESAMGMKALAEEYRGQAAALRAMLRPKYFDASRGLFADNGDKRTFSQQVNALAVVARVVEGPEARRLLERTVSEKLTPASIYFQSYLHEAFRVAGSGGRYLDLLGEWREQIKLGLTTWAEHYEPSRSDCHAWGSSPNVNLFKIVLGIGSEGPGFGRVRIAPNLGALESAEGDMPHPKGMIRVKVWREGGKVKAEYRLPPGVSGEYRDPDTGRVTAIPARAR